MTISRFKGLYLQATGDLWCFSFVTYTPQIREQMISCGDLCDNDEYLNPVLFDFLLFVSEAMLGYSVDDASPIDYDDLIIVASRARGSGVQSEYLIRLKQCNWCHSKQAQFCLLHSMLASKFWNGARLIDTVEE